MLSTTLELVGIGCFVAGVFVLLGPGAALLAAGCGFTYLGLAAEGVQPIPAARRRIATLRAARAAKKRNGS